MNSKGTKSGMSCNQSFEEDVCSNYSENSHLGTAVEPPSQAEDEPPIRVRDMINLYNFATQKNQELAQAKSLYFGAMQLDINGTDPQEQDEPEGYDGSCLKMDGSPACNRLHNKKPGNFRISSSEDHTSMHQTPLKDAASGESIEKSYQSKTTIKRTEQGVRIIIDIFFDKNESDIDIVGSRVETDIPESHILADFQQHSLAMRSQQSKKPHNV